MYRLIFFTLFFSQILLLSAQKYDFDYGLKAGINYSTVLDINQQLNYELTNQYKYRPGLNAGAFLMHDFTPYFGMDLELSGDVLGVYATSPTTRLSYYYASLPISFRFNIPDDFFITGGIVPSYFAWGTAKDIVGRIESTEAKVFFDPLNNFDLRWSSGIGWRNTDAFLLTLSFNQSIGAVSDEFPIRHQYFQLGMRYFIKDGVRKILEE